MKFTIQVTLFRIILDSPEWYTTSIENPKQNLILSLQQENLFFWTAQALGIWNLNVPLPLWLLLSEILNLYPRGFWTTGILLQTGNRIIYRTVCPKQTQHVYDVLNSYNGANMRTGTDSLAPYNSVRRLWGERILGLTSFELEDWVVWFHLINKSTLQKGRNLESVQCRRGVCKSGGGAS